MMGYKPSLNNTQPPPSAEEVVNRIDVRLKLETDPVEKLYLVGCREYYRRYGSNETSNHSNQCPRTHYENQVG